MPREKGRRLALSPLRRLVTDLLHFARKVPTVPVQRVMSLGRLRLARASAGRPVSWTAIFLKAFAAVAREFPQLRQAYLGFPFAHLYEHPHSVGGVTVEREHHGEQAVFMATVGRPEDKTLTELDERLRALREAPIEGVVRYRRALRMGRLPRPLRRLLWWLGLNVSGDLRSRTFGTFMLSVYSGLGAESLHPLTPLTATLNYGVIAADGAVTVRIVYDHRVLDGATVARALARMEVVLEQDLADELFGAGSRAVPA
jgi:hypothetical protein